MKTLEEIKKEKKEKLYKCPFCGKISKNSFAVICKCETKKFKDYDER